MKPLQMHVIQSGYFNSGHESPIAVAVTQKDAIEWLKSENWRRCRGKHNSGLWEQQTPRGSWMYARIDKVPLVRTKQ